MLGFLLFFIVSFLMLDVTLLMFALVPAFMPGYLGLLLTFVGAGAFNAGLLTFFLWAAPDLSWAVELKTAILATCVGMVAGLGGYFCIPDYIDLSRTRHAGEAIDVTSAHEHAGTGYRRFTGGAIQPRLMVHHKIEDTDSEGNPTVTHYYAAPVHSDRRRPGDATHLMVVSNGRPSLARWARESLPIQGMLVRSDRWHRRSLQLARDKGQRLRRDVVLLKPYKRSYSELLSSKRTWSWVVLGVTNGLWFLFAVWWGVKCLPRSRRA